MSAHPSEISALARKFFEYAATLHPGRSMVSISDVAAPSATAMLALDFLQKNGYLVGRIHRSTGNDEGVVAISDVRLTQRGQHWLAMLKRLST